MNMYLSIKKSVNFFSFLPPSLSEVSKLIWGGGGNFLQFSPENDLPTHKNLKFWSLVTFYFLLNPV